MKIKTMMIIKAIVCLCLGLPITIYPQFVYSIFGGTLAPGGIFAAREYGAAMLGIMLITWFSRNAHISDALWAVILGLTVYDAIGVVVTLIAIFTGAVSALAWLVVALYLFITLGFGWLLLKNPKP